MSLTLITGPMFSGKTSYLLSSINKYVIVKKNIIVVNHAFDKRYDCNGMVHSHDGKTIKINEKNKDIITQVSCSKLEYMFENISKEYMDCSAIFIDEGHFFDDIHQVDQMLKHKKNVYISFLNSDYKMESFCVMDKLYALADKIVHLTAVCTLCGNDAPFTKRLNTNNSKILVGSDESYEPRCRNCFKL